MGNLHALISCPDCGPSVKKDPHVVTISHQHENFEVNPANVDDLVENGLTIECMDCGKTFTKRYAESYLRELADKP